ncbi:MAG TPA: glycosyltransferase family 39 protein [Nitrospirota bacterium]|nr:glycosyltransferase family 39 protein [Nitrospirota bacterium]
MLEISGYLEKYSLVHRWTILAIFLLAFVFRLVPAVDTDFQIDEIFTLAQLRTCSSPVDVFRYSMNNDNNHLLNSLYCYFIGTNEAWVYRILSVLAGTATVVLIYLIGRRHYGPISAWISALMTSLSYPMIYYSAEARGYAVAAFFSLLSFHFFLELQDGDARVSRYAAFWSSCVLGVLSHYGFILVLAGYGIGECVVCLRSRFPRFRETLIRLMKMYLPVVIFLAIMYFFRIRSLEMFGGPVYDKLTVVGWFLSEVMNLPLRSSSWVMVTGALCTLALITRGLWSMYRDKGSTIVTWFIALLFGAPLFFIATRPPVIYTRFFFMLLPFVFLAIGHAVADIFKERSSLLRPLLISVAILFLVMSIQRFSGLAARGKTNYADVIRFILQDADKNNTGEDIVVHGFKPGVIDLVIKSYQERIAGASRIKLDPDLSKEGASMEYFIFLRDTMEIRGLEPESTWLFRLAGKDYRRLLYRSSADMLEADWILYRHVNTKNPS